MSIQTTYSQARANLASLCDEVTQNNETVIIHRRGADSVALISADELQSLTETAHLLSSPENAKRLMSALRRARARTEPVSTVDALRNEAGLRGRTK
jgi:antitoxin YefM